MIFIFHTPNSKTQQFLFQFDVAGEAMGILAAHPVVPLVSLHHLDMVEPIFPGTSRPESIRRLLQSAKEDSASLVQQSICYDKRRRWSISISWGYVVKLDRGLLFPPGAGDAHQDHLQLVLEGRPVHLRLQHEAYCPRPLWAALHFRHDGSLVP